MIVFRTVVEGMGKVFCFLGVGARIGIKSFDVTVLRDRRGWRAV